MSAMKTSKKKVVKKSPAKEVKIVLTMADWSSKGSGATILEALNALKSPIEICDHGVLTVTDGKRKAELDLTPHRMRRLFYPNSQVYVADELELLMK
jgi:hypothetical protein